MADFAALASTTAYLTLLGQISDRDAALALGLDPATATVTTPLTNTVRWNSSNKRWEIYNGTVWSELIAAATDAYNMTVTGLKGGTLYGNTANGGTISGGTVNATTLQQGGSPVWTAATLTNLNQLANGPGFITAAALSPYAPLVAPAFTGVPTAPTAVVDTSTTQLATTAFVIGQSYLKAAAAASTYAPLGGSGVSGTWGITVTGDAGRARGLTRSDSPVDPYAVQSWWDGTYWYLKGYNGATYHAEVKVGYATTAGTVGRLATPVTINGVSFDGSSAITVADATKAPLTGAGTSGTWPINISGNAGTASSATVLPPIYQGGSAGVLTGRNGRLGLYCYTTYGDPNAATYYAATLGFGYGNGGAGQSCEIMCNWVAQSGGLWYRALRDTISNWWAWTAIIDSANIGTYAPSPTGGGASGTWPINVTGSAATAGRLTTPVTINGVAFDGSAPITVTDATKAPLNGAGASGTWPINVTGSAGSCSGNAASASNVAWAGVTGKPVNSVTTTTATTTPTGGVAGDIVFQY